MTSLSPAPDFLRQCGTGLLLRRGRSFFAGSNLIKGLVSLPNSAQISWVGTRNDEDREFNGRGTERPAKKLRLKKAIPGPAFLHPSKAGWQTHHCEVSYKGKPLFHTENERTPMEN